MKPLLACAVAAAVVAWGCGTSNSAPASDAGVADGGADAGPDAGPDAGGASDGGDAGSAQPDGGSDAGPLPTIGGLFEQPEPWTLDVSALAKDGRSDAILAALGRLGGFGGNRLQIDFSIALFFADASTPRQTITAAPGMTYCYGGLDCDAVPLQMPLPANGNTEGSNTYACDTAHNDCHVLVVEKTQKKLYELYNSTQAGAGFTALGAFVWDLTKAYPANLRGDQCTSADAAGFPIAALLPTSDEVAAGEVKHALRFILPNARMKHRAYVHPATHAGAPSSLDANAPPYGVRLRLKQAFNEAPFNAGQKVILHALKKYGMLLADGGTIAFTFADDRTSAAKWASLGIGPLAFASIAVTDFEVVALGPEIALTDSCARNP